MKAPRSILSTIQSSLLKVLQAKWGVSDRESAILEFLVSGVTASKDISSALNISTSTINKHIESLCRKSGTQGRFEIISIWMSYISDLLRYFETIPIQWGNAYISEDEEGIVEILQKIVVQIGYTPVIVDDKKCKFSTKLNDLIIFDLSFENDGLTSILQASETKQNPLIIAITGNIPFMEKHANRFKWDRLFLKPFDLKIENEIKQLAVDRTVRNIIAA